MMAPYVIEHDHYHVGNDIVSASCDTLRLSRTSPAGLQHVLELSGSAKCVAFSPCGRRVGSYDGTIRIWSAITGEEESVLKEHLILM